MAWMDFWRERWAAVPFGANLDSLADLISFGTAPVFLAISAFHLPPHIWPVGIFFLLCGTLRLARFNVVSGKSDQFFEGLPIPAAGIALSASVLLGRPTLTIVLMLFLALLMTSSIPYPKIRDLRIMTILGGIFWWWDWSYFGIMIRMTFFMPHLWS